MESLNSNVEQDETPFMTTPYGVQTDPTDDHSDASSCDSVDERYQHFELPSFPEPPKFMSTSMYEANAPSEDRSASLVNVLLKPHSDSSNSFLRLNLWCILDGHGGGSVASYASEVLLPHIAVSVSERLNSEIISNGEFKVNDETRDMEDIEMQSLVAHVTDVGPNSIRYVNPEGDPVEKADFDNSALDSVDSPAVVSDEASVEGSVEADEGDESHDDCVSEKGSPPGTHCPAEIENVKKALTNSFLAVDAGWISSIDPTQVQTSCVSGGKWNAGACALVVCTIQRVGVDANTQHEAMLYTAHCGDCRAVLATSVPRPAASAYSVPQHSEFSDDDSDEDISPFSFTWSSPALTLMRPNKRRRMNCGDVVSASSSSNSLTRLESDGENDKNKDCDDGIYDLKAVELTADQNAYNMVEVGHVLARSNNAPRAISSASSGGIRRVAGSLAVTRALGDAYLKTPELSFLPYKPHLPYITARPDISHQLLLPSSRNKHSLSDKFLILASDGVWERSSNDEVVDWLQNFDKSSYDSDDEDDSDYEDYDIQGSSNMATCIVRGVINNICRIRRIPKRTLLNLPKGRPRRSKHDDITACVVDLSGFISI